MGAHEIPTFDRYKREQHDRLDTFRVTRVLSIQLSAIKDSDLQILKNQEILAINQDPVVGTSISPFRWGVNVCLHQ